jgi:RNA polymerase sigma-70 factor, ECF subfamily
LKRATDNELIARYLTGKARAFDQLLERYQEPLMAYLLRMTSNRAVSEDLFQETFIRVLRGLSKYEERGHFRSWLYRMATNLCIDYFRQQGRRPNVSLDQSVSGDTTASLQDILPDKKAGPERKMREARVEAAIDEAVQKLPETHRQVYLLRTVSELSFKEVAAVMDCPLGTALGRMRDALAKLKQTLGEEWLLELEEK